MKITANKLIAFILCFGATFNSSAQGISFEKNESWEQIREKQMQEHKYIFVDCYATWCGPCKEMDEKVYPLKAVGDIYNAQFISVRLQMNKTSKDDKTTQNLYRIAETFERDYSITAYPTFLFLDENGKAVHKVAGSLSADDFIQLAKDAKNTEKQYYAQVKQFKPGKLDTTTEIELIKAFSVSDKTFASQLAADYLNRIDQRSYNELAKQKLLVLFQTDPVIQRFIVTYLGHLDIASFINTKRNIDFIGSIKNLPQVQAKIIGYFSRLTRTDWLKEENVHLAGRFSIYPDFTSLVNKYIDNLSANELYYKANLQYLELFTKTSLNRGFEIFFKHGLEADRTLGENGLSDGIVESILENEEVAPAIAISKTNGATPDFRKIRQQTSQKYGSLWGTRINLYAKLSWYSYLARDRKKQEYWPHYTSARIANVNFYKTDTIITQAHALNNISWEIFVHNDDKMQLDTVAEWMAGILKLTPDEPTIIDTYACLLYKAGHQNEAIDWEKKALAIYHRYKKDLGIAYTQRIIDKMKAGDLIWREQEYQQ